MPSWITSLFTNPIGDIKTLWHKFTGLIAAVYTYFGGLISALENELSWLDSIVNRYVSDIWHGITSVYDLARWIITIGIPNVVHWAENELAKAWDYAIGLYHWAVSELSRLASWIQAEIANLAKWVIRNIWDPIWNRIRGIIQWIQNEGTYVYYLLTHPDRLAMVIGRYLLGSWVSIAERYSSVFIRWILHKALSESGTVSRILENVISSLL